MEMRDSRDDVTVALPFRIPGLPAVRKELKQFTCAWNGAQERAADRNIDKPAVRGTLKRHPEGLRA